jgi:hypothetical protein
MRQQRLVSGRLWERHTSDEMSLEFTSLTLEFLFWLTADHQRDVALRATQEPARFTTGDALFQLIAYRRLRGTPIHAALQRWPLMGHNAVALLSYPSELTHSVLQAGNVDWSSWITGPQSWCLEALQWQLADQWVASELQKVQDEDPSGVLQVAADQQEVLDALYGYLNQTHRWDLARFLLIAVQRLLNDASYWGHVQRRVCGLKVPEERVRWGLASTVVVRQLRKLHDWERQARQIGYYDAGYASAQLWLDAWEVAGGRGLCDRLNALLYEVLGELAGGRADDVQSLVR